MHTNNGKIVKVSGPLVVAVGLPGIKMYEVVRAGKPGLIGEVIELHDEKVSIQVYEDTSGIGPGEPVVPMGEPLSVELGPGLLTSIYDGIQRPLDVIRSIAGDYIIRGINVPGIDHKKKWEFSATAKKGDMVEGGDIIGEVQETTTIKHKIMVPQGIKGRITAIKDAQFTVEDTICEIEDEKGSHKVKMLQKWPVRQHRPFKQKYPATEPLVTGTRVIDTFFPIAKGGTGCIPGPFGSGKTVVLHQLAKWSDADIIVYVGCGERGNEMTDVLMEFPELKDPKTGEALLKRTVLIANTSNMPVAAREASVYTGITIGEYFRDMGYKVALMADSTSRWAEALREMSGRLEEMPGEEGYPAYLATRIAGFYERTGLVECTGSKTRRGSLTAIGAVSPPGGDLSDPVVQCTLRMVKVFWSLEATLAYQRHFPAISWLRSYSLYLKNVKEWLDENMEKDFIDNRNKAIRILQEEESLQEIVRLVGIEALSFKDRLTLDTAKSIREDFLHQHAFDPKDTYTPLKVQYRMLRVICLLHELCMDALNKGLKYESISGLKVKEKIARMKFIAVKEESSFDEIEAEINSAIQAVYKSVVT